jgi:hypothetical protein
MQCKICSGPYLEYDIPVIGEDPVAFCAESLPVTAGCPSESCDVPMRLLTA